MDGQGTRTDPLVLSVQVDLGGPRLSRTCPCECGFSSFLPSTAVGPSAGLSRRNSNTAGRYRQTCWGCRSANNELRAAIGGDLSGPIRFPSSVAVFFFCKKPIGPGLAALRAPGGP